MEIVYYVLLVLVNGSGDGPLGNAFPSLEICNEQRAEVAKIPDVIVLSDCTRVVLKKP